MTIRTLYGDCRQILPTLDTGSVQLVATSPPYFGQRTYGDNDREIGQTGSMLTYLAELQVVMAELHRVLDADGTCWVVLGDKAAGSGGAGGDHKADGAKSWIPTYGRGLTTEGVASGQWCLIPYRFAIDCQANGWQVRSMITWDKTPTMRPESALHANRPLVSTETIVLLAKKTRHRWFPTRLVEPADVWHIRPFRGPKAARHYAPYPLEIPERAILAATQAGDTVLDPFGGSHTTALAADAHSRHAVSIELYAPELTT